VLKFVWGGSPLPAFLCRTVTRGVPRPEKKRSPAHNVLTMPQNEATSTLTSRSGAGRFRRWQKILLAIVALIVILVLVFDWNWLRGPLERYISKRTEREFHISHLDVDLGLNPTIKLKDVYFANAPWSKIGEPMARIGSLEFSVSLRDLWDHKLLVPRAALSQADLVFERAADQRKNWVLKTPARSAEPGLFRISSISVDQAHVRYLDHGDPLTVDVTASTFSPTAASKASDAKASAVNTSYTTKFAFKGAYHGAEFSGDALTGDVLSFQESNIPFPIRGRLNVGTTTHIDLEGTIADVVDISSVDMQLQIEGQTLASLYPFLLLPLPASPPYAFRGHLLQSGNRYAIDDLSGKIGSTDIHGGGAYVRQEPRPLLTAKLNSKLLNIADLGPIIGLETKDTKKTTASAAAGNKLSQADTSTRAQAQAKERQTAGDKILPAGTVAAKGDGILPSGKFEGGRLKAIDAEVDYAAERLKAPTALPVENMKFSFRLHDAVAKLQPLEFGFAGGRIVSEITIDARQEQALRSTINADFRNIQVAKLFPTMPKIARGVGELGAQIRLDGTGNSIADAAGTSNGSVTAAIANGRISNMIDAIAGLNGGKVISLFVAGDKDIAVNCGGVAFSVKDGIGQSQLFVIDTEQTRVDGSGSFNLKDERFDITISPKPKKPGILSLRTPVHLYGSFRHPEFELDKGQLMARAGGAIALALINPLAALIPLIETGPGTNTDCARLLAPVKGATQQAKTTDTAPPKAAPQVSAKK
jgi:uncharacterized protein involved in outer membrane biogenesis